MFKKIWLYILIFFSLIGPAIISGTANNDAGGISTYAYAGSKFGYLLLWVLVMNLVTLGCTQEIGIRLGVFTGKGLAALIRERFGIRWTFLAILTLFIANLAVTTSEFAGLAAVFEMYGISKYLTIPILAVLIWFVVFKGSFKKLEKFFLAISMFLLVYVVSAFMSQPDWGQVIKSSFTPNLPLNTAYFFTLLGIMGTTITPWGQFFIQSYVVDKGMHPRHYKAERIIIYFSAFFTCFIAAMIMITTKNVLFDHGIVVDSAEKAALALKPFLGLMAKNIFALGFFAASLLGAFILPLSTSYSVCEAFGFEHGIDKKMNEAPVFYGLMGIAIIFSSIIILLPAVPLFKIMIAAQVLNGLLLPIILVFLILLLNKGAEIGLPQPSKKEKFFYNIVSWEAIVRLTIVSFLLILFTLAPSLLEKTKVFFALF